MESKYFLARHKNGFHRVAYKEWNRFKQDRVLLCVHGYSRNSRDFDFLAEALEPYYRVVAIDLPGHGESDSLPSHLYTFELLLNDVTTLIAALGVDEIYWLGSSMGGSMGITLARAIHTPIRKLLINDQSPIYIPPPRPRDPNSTERIKKPKFKTVNTFAEAEAHIKRVYSGWGNMDEKYWQHLVEQSFSITEDGKYLLLLDLNFDLIKGRRPSTATRLRYWKMIQCPIYLIYGEVSPFLTPEVLQIMQELQPHMKTAKIKGVGHHPSLMEPEHIAIIKDWLLE